MLNLDSVTLCAIDCINPELALRALLISSEKIKFKEIIFLTDKETQSKNDSIKTIQIERLSSIEDYSNFIFNKLFNFFDTEHILIIQWDGYIINPNLWSNEFLKFDYIGAPWKDGTVGNGGFSLRSRKLLSSLNEMKIPKNLTKKLGEDEIICKILRHELSNTYSMKFADSAIGSLFSLNHLSTQNKNESFGFHGLWNMWQSLNGENINDFLKLLDKKTIQCGYLYDLCLNLFNQGRFNDTFISLQYLLNKAPGNYQAFDLLKQVEKQIHLKNTEQLFDQKDINSPPEEWLKTIQLEENQKIITFLNSRYLPYLNKLAYGYSNSNAQYISVHEAFSILNKDKLHIKKLLWHTPLELDYEKTILIAHLRNNIDETISIKTKKLELKDLKIEDIPEIFSDWGALIVEPIEIHS